MLPANGKVLLLSLFAAWLGHLLPWGGVALVLRPDFVLLMLLYWLLRAPMLCNVGIAWTMGLLVDLAHGGLFGQQALAYAFTAFLVLTYRRRLVLFSKLQQAAYVFLLLLLTQIALLVLKLFAGGTLPGPSYFLPSLSGILLWQLVVFLAARRADNPA